MALCCQGCEGTLSLTLGLSDRGLWRQPSFQPGFLSSLRRVCECRVRRSRAGPLLVRGGALCRLWSRKTVAGCLWVPCHRFKEGCWVKAGSSGKTSCRMLGLKDGLGSLQSGAGAEISQAKYVCFDVRSVALSLEGALFKVGKEAGCPYSAPTSRAPHRTRNVPSHQVSFLNVLLQWTASLSS